MTLRITSEHVRRARAAVAKHYGVDIDDGQARAVLRLDTSLLDELGPDGDMDTLSRSDLGDALIAWLVPGPPTVEDGLIGERQECWHWPCIGSDERYRRAFVRAFRKAVATRCPVLLWKRARWGRQETHCGRYMVAHNVNLGEINRRWFAYKGDEGKPGEFDEPMTFDGFETRDEAKRYCEVDARGGGGAVSESTSGLLVNESRILRGRGDAGLAELLELAASELDALPSPGYYPPSMSPTPTTPDPAPDSPAAKLRAAREKAGLSQSAAASRMPGSVAVQYWSDVERGRRSPSLEWLWDASRALGCNPHSLDVRLASKRWPSIVEKKAR